MGSGSVHPARDVEVTGHRSWGVHGAGLIRRYDSHPYPPPWVGVPTGLHRWLRDRSSLPCRTQFNRLYCR